jgi:hypothetical protein
MEEIGGLVQMLVQGMVSAVFIWAWSLERRERQERERQHREERNAFTHELISLAREAYGLGARQAAPVPSAANDSSRIT